MAHGRVGPSKAARISTTLSTYSLGAQHPTRRTDPDGPWSTATTTQHSPSAVPSLRHGHTLQPAHRHPAPVRVAPPPAPAALPAPDPHAVSPADRRVRIINLAAVIIPFLGLAAAMLFLWGGAFNWLYLALLFSISIPTSLGVTVGYHRLFTHKSFKCGPAVRAALAIFGSMAAEGPVVEWAGTHRKHHQHSDSEGDPHSPHCHADGESWGADLRGTLRGLYHAHFGWLFAEHIKGLGRYTKDLREDRLLMAINRQFPMWVLFGLALPTVVAGLVTMSFTGALLGFIWGGLVRILMVHHITWGVNSVCHLWGARPFRCGDESRNNPIVGIIAFGEGWHNNHHAFPTSARHGLRPWEIDISYMVILALKAVGLAHDLRIPDAARIEAKRRGPETTPEL